MTFSVRTRRGPGWTWPLVRDPWTHDVHQRDMQLGYRLLNGGKHIVSHGPRWMHMRLAIFVWLSARTRSWAPKTCTSQSAERCYGILITASIEVLDLMIKGVFGTAIQSNSTVADKTGVPKLQGYVVLLSVKPTSRQTIVKGKHFTIFCLLLPPGMLRHPVVVWVTDNRASRVRDDASDVVPRRPPTVYTPVYPRPQSVNGMQSRVS